MNKYWSIWDYGWQHPWPIWGVKWVFIGYFPFTENDFPLTVVASICNVNAAGISPNNMIKFYDAIYGVFRVNEWKRCVILKPSELCYKQVNWTSGALEQRVLRGVMLIGCSPYTQYTPTNLTSRTAFFSILTVHLEILLKILNKFDHGEKVMEKFCGAIVAFQFWLNEFRVQWWLW